MNEMHFVGYESIHDKSFEFESPSYSGCYLLLVTHTPVIIYTDGQPCEYPENTAVFYKPNSPVHYKAAKDIYSDSWLRFYSDEAFVTSFPLVGEPFTINEPEYIHNLMQLITWETSESYNFPRIYRHAGSDVSPACAKENSSYVNQPIIDDLLRILFKKLSESVINKSISAHETQMLILRRKISAAPEKQWNIPDIARKMNLSCGHFQSLYKQQFGVACMDDIINLRLRKSQDYLLHSTQSIAMIAENCGYNSHEHFSRQFKSRYGVTPGVFRKKLRAE